MHGADWQSEATGHGKNDLAKEASADAPIRMQASCWPQHARIPIGLSALVSVMQETLVPISVPAHGKCVRAARDLF